MEVSIAILGRPSVNTNRPVSRNSRRNRTKIGPSSRGSDNTRSSAARSSGSCLTSTGKDSSHKHSTRPDHSVSMHSPLSQEPAHMQGILTVTPDGNTPSNPLGLLEGRREAPAFARHCRLIARFLPPPPRSVHAVLPHTAHRRSSPPAFGYLPRQARWGLGATTVPERLIKPKRFGER